MKLTLANARALLITAQGLHTRPPQPAQKEDLLTTIRQMGLLQIDTISVVARSPYLVLWSRLGAYEPRWLDELHAEGALFEYWAHAACFLPIEDFPLYRHRMLELRRHHRLEEETMRQVLERVREQGAVRSMDFVRADKKRGTWWDWKPEKAALEYLFNCGLLMIPRREGFQRVYDLHERVLPDWDEAQTLSQEASYRALALKAVKALGVARPRWLTSYFPDLLRARTGKLALSTLLETLVQEGLLILAEVEEWTEAAYIHRDNLTLAQQIADGAPQPSRTTLLSPFDPVVSDRSRAEALFGFAYRIETYTRSENRRYGYFSLPILHRDQLVGRLDAKAHRKEGLFEVKVLHLEPGVTVTEDLVQALRTVLVECAAWHKTPELVVRRTDPPELAALI